MTTWYELIADEMNEHGESWHDAVSSTLDEHETHRGFHAGYGSAKGSPFTVWTTKRVYFPAVYDGAEWCASVARNPDGVPTEHVGGQ